MIARNCTKSQFESFWGVTLASNVVFVNSGDHMPQINGSENYTLKNASGVSIDGPTYSMAAAAGQSLQRSTCGAANLSGSWSIGTWSAATPGGGAIDTCGKGVFIGEFSDALGTGNYIYEFVELFNDR
jgi:hypothetical protein